MKDGETEGQAGARQSTIRELFPYLEEVVYLDTAAAGISWQGQGAAAARFYDEHKSRGYTGSVEWRAELARTRGLLSQLLRVAPDQISFVASTTEALNLVAHGVRLGPGDQVVLCEDEFPSILLAWSPAALRQAELVRVPIRQETTRTDELIERISERTRVVCVSHVHWCTGTRVDLDRIAAAAHRVGARLVVDGAHATGAIEVNASEADIYTGPVFKWLLSGFGLAYVITKASFAPELEPTFRGYHNEASRNLQYGHANYPVMYALSATLDLLGGLGWPWIHSRVSCLTGLLHEGLVQAGWSVVTPKQQRAGIVSLLSDNPLEVVASLARQGVAIAERSGFLRVSPHFYNTEADIQRFLSSLGSR